MSEDSDLLNEVRALAAGETTEQEKTIASVVLAGWRIVPIGETEGRPASLMNTYLLFGPDGTSYGRCATRYTAACKAETYIWEGEKIEALMPNRKRR